MLLTKNPNNNLGTSDRRMNILAFGIYRKGGKIIIENNYFYIFSGMPKDRRVRRGVLAMASQKYKHENFLRICMTIYHKLNKVEQELFIIILTRKK